MRRRRPLFRDPTPPRGDLTPGARRLRRATRAAAYRPEPSERSLIHRQDDGGRLERRGLSRPPRPVAITNCAAGCSVATRVHEPSERRHLFATSTTRCHWRGKYPTPGSNPSGTVVAVEFYNAALQHYFLSDQSRSRSSGLAAGVLPWAAGAHRLPLSLAYATPVRPRTDRIPPFYRAPAYGDSHFYSVRPVPAECAATAAAASGRPDLRRSQTSSYIQSCPVLNTGACPAGHVAHLALFQSGDDHRYTADQATRDDMRASPTI